MLSLLEVIIIMAKSKENKNKKVGEIGDERSDKNVQFASKAIVCVLCVRLSE